MSGEPPFERRLCRRNLVLGEVSEGAVEAPSDEVAVLGPGRIGRQIALACALGGCRVRLVDLKARAAGETRAAFAEARREIARDLGLMVEEGVITPEQVASTLTRIEDHVGLEGLETCGFVQEALPERLELKRAVFAALAGRVSPDAILASTTSTISPAHLADSVPGPERFVVAHWLNPAHIIPLVEVVAGAKTAPAVVARTLAFLTRLGKTPVRCADSPGFIVPRLQVLLMNEAVRLVEEGVAPPEEVDRAIRAGLGFRYATVGVFEFIDWGGLDILYRASDFMTRATGDPRYKATRLVEEKMARNELGPKTGRGFFEYAGEARERFETAKVRALLRQLRREREGP
jgi:3-hydroxybutyryl-CoA dehydrogenase